MSPAERTYKLKLLGEAEKAYHLLMTSGGVRTLVDQNGERIEYNTLNASRLLAYITSLKSELGMLKPLGPARFIF